MLDPISGETIYQSNGSEDAPGMEESAVDEFCSDDNNLESNLRRRKGKIMSCAKETIEQGKSSTHSHQPLFFFFGKCINI